MSKIKWPYFDLSIRVPFITIHTDLMCERFETDVLEYVMLYIKVWKWEFKTRLYSPGYRR